MKMTNLVKLFLSICFLFYLTTNAQVMKNNIDPTTGLPVTITESPQGNTLLSASGGNVLWDLTHGIYLGYEPANKYSNLVTALQAAGYTISTTTDFGSANLSTIKVLVISLGSAWNSAYTPTEITKIQTFVQNGGGLLILGDNAGTTVPNVNIKPIAQAFGVTLGVSSISPSIVLVTNFTAHSIFNVVSELYIQVGGEITATSPATIMAREPGNKGIIAVAQSGSGRVIVVGDINFCENVYIGLSNNQKFSINAFDWLSGALGKFDFNDGTTQGWIKEGAFDENGDGPFFNNFSFEWYDHVNYPNASGKDPTGDKKGALTLYTWSGHGVANPNTSAQYWIMRYKSPDLSGSSTWQNAKGYTAEIAECFASTGEFFANLFVIVYDKDQAKDRYFYNGTAVKLTHDVYNDNNATWNHLTFDWSGISTFPTNFTIKNIFVNLWGRMSAVLGQGGTYLDEVVPILPATIPDIASNPPSWDYGAIIVGNNSDKTFVVKNEGTENLNVTATSPVGANALEFSIQTGGGTFTLAPGSTRDIVIKFAPTGAGSKSAALSISSNDPDENPFLISLTGSGTATLPDISVTPTLLDFGAVEVGGFQEYSVTIKNDGPGTLNVTGTTLSGTNAGEFSIQSGGGAFSLTTGATRNLTIRFKPVSGGSKTAVLSIASNDPDENPFTVNLKGNAVVVLQPDISASPIPLDFGTVSMGGYQEKTVTIKNDGAGMLNVSATTLTGTNAGEFTIQSGGGAFTLSMGSTRNVVLRFTPTTPGNKTAALSIASNDPDENPLLVNLVGSGAGAGAPILPTITNPLQMAGTEFIINIEVGTNGNPVTDLFGVSFKLNYTNTNYVNYVSAEPGPFIGSDVIFFPTADDPNGKVSIGISRKSGQGGVNGFGSISKIKFTTVLATPHNTAIDFSLTDVVANNSTGTPINLTPGALKITIQSGVLVWPGDTNNSGKVDQADVLPLGLHWERTGPPRQGASTLWTGQLATPWTIQAATYADANGDGKVNQADVLSIGLNWNKTHTMFLLTNEIPLPHNLEKVSAPQLTIKITGDANPNQDFFIDIIGNNLANVLGLSFELVYTPVSLADLQSVEIGPENILGTDPIFFPMINKTFGVDSGKVSVGISRKFNEGGITGSGLITRIVANMSAGAIPNVSQTMITFQNVLANDPTGNPIALEVVPYTLITHVDNSIPELPPDFVLFDNYPNPFNPGTTISFSCPQPSDVTLIIYDLQGQKVRQLVRGEMAAGQHKTYWNGQDERGKVVAAGIYFYQIEAKLLSSGQRHVMVKKMTLMK
ncbi:choice-of-anchor D domain-containing protein [candidate division KSB1 bacterium]|nr:choice-of-anchor D domain-containing protein [candidate division KSB1 bacterium]